MKKVDLSNVTAAHIEPNRISIAVTVLDLQDAVLKGFPRSWLDSAVRNLFDKRIEVVDEEQVHSVPSVLRLLHNVHVPMFRKFPHCLRIVR